VDLEDPMGVTAAIHCWLARDLRLGVCPDCPSEASLA
jgi:hypothetical protein